MIVSTGLPGTWFAAEKVSRVAKSWGDHRIERWREDISWGITNPGEIGEYSPW